MSINSESDEVEVAYGSQSDVANESAASSSSSVVDVYSSTVRRRRRASSAKSRAAALKSLHQVLHDSTGTGNESSDSSVVVGFIDSSDDSSADQRSSQSQADTTRQPDLTRKHVHHTAAYTPHNGRSQSLNSGRSQKTSSFPSLDSLTRRRKRHVSEAFARHRPQAESTPSYKVSKMTPPEATSMRKLRLSQIIEDAEEIVSRPTQRDRPTQDVNHEQDEDEVDSIGDYSDDDVVSSDSESSAQPNGRAERSPLKTQTKKEPTTPPISKRADSANSKRSALGWLDQMSYDDFAGNSASSSQKRSPDNSPVVKPRPKRAGDTAAQGSTSRARSLFREITPSSGFAGRLRKIQKLVNGDVARFLHFRRQMASSNFVVQSHSPHFSWGDAQENYVTLKVCSRIFCGYEARMVKFSSEIRMPCVGGGCAKL